MPRRGHTASRSRAPRSTRSCYARPSGRAPSCTKAWRSRTSCGMAGRSPASWFDRRRMVREVLATGPFAQWARRPVADGALLVGDAADFFDPFTGQGIYAALRGAELAADSLIPRLTGGADAPISATTLEPYVRARRREFAGKWALERLIGVGVGWPALTNRVVSRLARRPDLADLVVGATGNFVPAHRVLAPGVLARLLL